uniref:Uncharacterized protein n=1 Tax=Eutreptiella gymnastica TaxID=73025 RepID=A0A7S4G195_9EUGL
MALVPQEMGRKRATEPGFHAEERRSAKAVNAEARYRNHGDLINPRHSFVPLPTDRPPAGQRSKAYNESTIQAMHVNTNSCEVFDTRRVRKGVTQALVDKQEKQPRTLVAHLHKNDSNIQLGGDTHSEDPRKERLENTYHERVVAEGFPAKNPNPSKCKRQYAAHGASTPSNKENGSPASSRRTRHYVAEPQREEETPRRHLRITPRSVQDRRWGCTHVMPDTQPDPKPRRKYANAVGTHRNLQQSEASSVRSVKGRHDPNQTLHPDVPTILPNENLSDPANGDAASEQELHRVRSGTFSPRGRATSPITGMAVTPETAWQHSPFEQGSYATEAMVPEGVPVRRLSAPVGVSSRHSGYSPRNALKRGDKMDVHSWMSLSTQKTGKRIVNTPERERPSDNLTHHEDILKASVRGRKMLPYADQVGLSDPITHFETTLSASNQKPSCPSRKRRSPVCTGVSTELSGPGARTGRARERPQTSPNPILPESQPPSLSADCLPKTPPATARSIPRSETCSSIGFGPRSSSVGATPTPFRSGRRTMSPSARNVSILTWA